MRKLTALVLALILALAAIPALGEEAEGFTGTWYVNMFGMTVGTFELAEDNTMKGTMVEDEIEGTWEATETGVIITVADEPLALTADEKGLVAEEADLYLTREPEKVTLEALATFVQTGEIPEGVTEEEMMAVFTAVFGGLSGEDAPAEEATEETVAEEVAPVEEAVEEAEAAAEEVAAEGIAAVEEAVEEAEAAVEEAAAESVAAVEEAVEEAAAEEVAAVEEAVEEAEAATEEAAPAEEEAAPAEEAPAEEAVIVMSHDEYMAAAIDDEVLVLTYVQATQSWWDNKITVYAQSQDGAYFIYNMACSEEDAAKLVPGTPILVKGYKAEWSGEIEIADATFSFPEEAPDPFIAEPEDVTAKLGTDELINCQNELVTFKGMTVEAYDETGAAFAYKNAENKTDDLYFKVSKDGQTYDFCVEFYLCGQDTEVYKAVEALNVGDVIDITGFLYWYEGANPHVVSIVKAE